MSLRFTVDQAIRSIDGHQNSHIVDVTSAFEYVTEENKIPVDRALRELREARESGSVRAHIVRGHFKDCRRKRIAGNEKAKGIYWWQPHSRGNARKGIIAKDVLQCGYQVSFKENSMAHAFAHADGIDLMESAEVEGWRVHYQSPTLAITDHLQSGEMDD